MKTLIDFDALTPLQLKQLSKHFYERSEALLSANISLIARLGSGENASPDDHIRLLNEWTSVNEQIIHASDEEVTRIVAVCNAETLS